MSELQTFRNFFVLSSYMHLLQFDIWNVILGFQTCTKNNYKTNQKFYTKLCIGLRPNAPSAKVLIRRHRWPPLNSVSSKILASSVVSVTCALGHSRILIDIPCSQSVFLVVLTDKKTQKQNLLIIKIAYTQNLLECRVIPCCIIRVSKYSCR